MPKQSDPEPSRLSRADEIELRWKELQIEEMEERIAQRVERRKRLQEERQRQYQDFLKSEAVRQHRQTICKHRKGGIDNKFWNGNSPNYSIIENTYPHGAICIMCTRCGKEVWKPPRQLRIEDPARYADMWAEWKLWKSYPTDNTPSGSKLFEVYEHVA